MVMGDCHAVSSDCLCTLYHGRRVTALIFCLVKELLVTSVT
jgi:hypothetical protein